MGDFYCRYYVGHEGKFGHEFMEFELFADGRLRYANNSNYKNDRMIRKEAKVGPGVVEEFKKIIRDSEVIAEDDSRWPEPDAVGRQELEIKLDTDHISFMVPKYTLISSFKYLLKMLIYAIYFSAEKLEPWGTANNVLTQRVFAFCITLSRTSGVWFSA